MSEKKNPKEMIQENLRRLSEHKDHLFFKYTFVPEQGDIQVKDEKSSTMLFMRAINYEEAQSRVRANELIVVIKHDSEIGRLSKMAFTDVIMKSEEKKE